jgi:hypothetical protein
LSTTSPPDRAGITHPNKEQLDNAIEIVREESARFGPITVYELLDAMGVEQTDEMSWLMRLFQDLCDHPNIQPITDRDVPEFYWEEGR